MAESQSEATIPHGEEIVERFGGIRPMAAKLEVPVTTVQGWKKRDAIPLSRRDDIISAAAQYNISLKGLISEGSIANQNSRIEEDPALRPSAAPYSAPRPAAAPTPATHAQDGVVDMKQIYRAARTTSFITSASLVAVTAIAGVLLFGGSESGQNRQLSSLETRVSNIEAQSPVAINGGSIPSSLNATITEIQGKIDTLTSAIGATGQDMLSSGTTLLQRLQNLEQQLTAGAGANGNLQGALENMQTMAATPQGQATWQAAIDELRTVVGNLQGRVDGLDTALAQAKTQNEALAVTLNNVSGRDLSAAAMLLALTQVREAVDRQQPFADDLALLRQVAQSADPELAASVDRMAPYAETGVLSSSGLKRELQGLSNDIITAKLKGEDVALKDRIMARLQGLFSLKKDGVPVTGGEERALIEQASRQLDNDDVAGAMATLQQLQGPAAEAAAPWNAKAAATLAVQNIDEQMVTALINKVRGMTSSAPAPIDLRPQEAPVVQQPQIQMTEPEAGQPQLAPMPSPDAPAPDASNSAPSTVIIQQ